MRHRPRPWMPAVALLLGCQGSGLGWRGDGPTLDEYRAAFAREVGDRLTAAASLAALKSDLRSHRVLWLGDHHRDRRLHDLQRDLLRELHAAGIPMALCLEAIATQDEYLVREYVDGRLGLAALRTAIEDRWAGSWLEDTDVDAEHYRQVIEFAKATSSPVFGLEPVPRLPLGQRDDVIAASVRRAAAIESGRLVVVFVGQTHLLGHGDLPERTGLPAVALGGLPTPALQLAARRRTGDAEFVCSSGGLWFFAGLLAP